MIRSRQSLLASAAMVAFATASAAAAQDGPPRSAAAKATQETGGDIVVTAQRRESSLQKTPIAISAFTASMLQDRGVVKLENIAASTPGLNITAVTASPNAILISMRGAFEQNGGTSTSESPVAIYIDDVYQSRLSAANYDLADIERVEVLRGPQGTLYGRNSMTGAIKLITRQPNGQFWFNTDLSYASFHELKGKASAGTALSPHVALAASAFYDKRSRGFQYDEVLDKRVGTFERYGAQVAVGLYDVPNVEAVVTGRYSAGLSDGQHFAPLDPVNGGSLASGFYNTRTPLPAEGDIHQKSIAFRLGYDFGPVKLRSITAHQKMTDVWAIDFSGGFDVGPKTTIAGFYRHSDAHQRQFTQEFQLLGKTLDDRLNYIVGLFYFDEHSSQEFNDIYLGYRLLPSSFQMKSTSKAGYAQADYKITDRLTVSAGIRFSHDKKNFDGLSQDGFANFPATQAASKTSLKASVWTPRLNLTYNISPTALVYATASRGYRAGGFNSLVVANPASYGSPYAPETVWSYEGGLKLQGFDRKAHLNLVGYYEKLKTLQTLTNDPTSPGSFITQNAAGARIYGIEVEAGANPVTGLSLFLSGAYTNDKYTKLDPASQAAQVGAERLPEISRWQWQVGGSYELRMGEHIGSLVLAGDINHRSPYYTQVALYPQSKVDAFTRANASLTYKTAGKHLEFYVQATNIGNSKDYSSSLVFIPGVFGNLFPQEPRIWRGGFRYKF